MKLINRSALVVRPKQPYVSWVNNLDSQVSGLEQELTLEQHLREGRVYLIDEQPQLGELNDILKDHWQMMFENELGGWDEFADHWPTPLSQTQFESWFDVQPQLMVFDLSSDALLVADISEL
ncbi:MAG: hypothetical protein V7677_12215 [Motiliproteus sp.]